MWRHCIHCSVETQKSAASVEQFYGSSKSKTEFFIFPAQLSTCPQELKQVLKEKRKKTFPQRAKS